ncbi:MAG TPA: radical SAM family heme chaperone HemW [Desulfuromonadales bacterium]|nr:radical SAM family heme chaperone HemW [Desulfuromonadales bacterium]
MPALYLHVPFCRRKCPYCDFFSLPGNASQLAHYPDLLIRHLRLAASSGLWQGPFSTVFFGGGTPSLLPAEAVARVLTAARTEFGLEAAAEVTLEANPGTVTPASLAGYLEAGINRLSLGVQSLDESGLRTLGRVHTAAEACQAIAWARPAGFANVSLDLMFALPGQTVRDLHTEVGRLLALSPDHLSCYGLSVEEQTPFYHLHRRGDLELPDEERYAALFLALHERLTQAGYTHYEISNYARPGRQCRHNLGYWQRLSYLGVGAGAHSFLDAGWGERQSVPPDLNRYARGLGGGENPAQTLETFDHRGAMAETLYLGLRTAAGVDDDRFRQRFGLRVAEAFPAAIEKAGRHLRLKDGFWTFDLDGWLLYDHLITPFL